MNRKDKVDLLNKLNASKITLGEFKIAMSIDKTMLVFIWDEIEPGVFYNAVYDIKVLPGDKMPNDGHFHIPVINFYDSGGEIPPMASNEKDVDFDWKTKLSHAIKG
jgi:hypothetical protein